MVGSSVETQGVTVIQLGDNFPPHHNDDGDQRNANQSSLIIIVKMRDQFT